MGNSKYTTKENEILKDYTNLLLRTSGKDRPIASLGAMQEYALLFSTIPNASTITIPRTGLDGCLITDHMNKHGWTLFKQYGGIGISKREVVPFGQLWIDPACYAMISISANKVSKTAAEYWIDPQDNVYAAPSLGEDTGDEAGNEYVHSKEKTRLTITDITYIHPPVYSDKYDEKNLLDFAATLKDLVLEDKRDARIGVISTSGNDYDIKDFSLEGKVPDMKHMDKHYGDGFEIFHNSLLKRIEHNTKGLILFHGEPGTGKTHYIRYMLAELAKINKTIIYFSPSMASAITQPAMMSFLSTWITENEKDCVILIEDAEPLLETRNSQNRSEGITNLLNMTDGILNDMLGVTVICTFNTDISKIDAALLRPERLMARKYFGRLSQLDVTELSKVVDIDVSQIDCPATLAEIYSLKKENEILEHGTEKRKSIGF
jgi:hypothetical protein